MKAGGSEGRGRPPTPTGPRETAGPLLRRAREQAYAREVGAEAEARWGWATPAGRVRAERRARLCLEAADIHAGQRVLELGCGNGLFTGKYLAAGVEIFAVDLSAELIGLAVQNPDRERAYYCLAAADQLPFPDQSFDAVLGNSILHHLDLAPAGREIFRLLKPGGAFAFAEPNLLNPQIFLQRTVPFLRRAAGDSPDETAFVRFQLRGRLSQLGFCQVQITPFDFLHPATPPGLIPALTHLGRLLEQAPLARELSGSLLISGRKP